MRASNLMATVLVSLLAGLPALGLAAGTDEPPPPPRPAPKPAPKPDPKTDPKDAPKAAPNAAVDSDYAAGRIAVQARDWQSAIALLSRAALRDPDNANLQSYLGFSNRSLGNWEVAMQHYRTALKLNPQHRGATEYIGQAYLLRGNMQLAVAQLNRLEKICGRGCEEYASLARAIDDVRANPK